MSVPCTIVQEPEEATAPGSIHERLHLHAGLCGRTAGTWVARYGRKPTAAFTWRHTQVRQAGQWHHLSSASWVISQWTLRHVSSGWRSCTLCGCRGTSLRSSQKASAGWRVWTLWSLAATDCETFHLWWRTCPTSGETGPSSGQRVRPPIETLKQ